MQRHKIRKKEQERKNEKTKKKKKRGHKETKKQRIKKEKRKKERKKDEEAIALGTTLEQRFAIGPEAGGAKKGRICASWYNNNHNQLMHLLKRFFIQTQPIYAFGYAPFLL